MFKKFKAAEPEQKAWIQSRIEGSAGLFASTAEEKREVLEHLTETEGFEQFLHRIRLLQERDVLLVDPAARQCVVRIAAREQDAGRRADRPEDHPALRDDGPRPRRQSSWQPSRRTRDGSPSSKSEASH